MANTDANDPLYVRVQRDLMEMLKQDEYKPGAKIPSERELSIRFGASRMTTRKAVEQLVDRGALERRGTSGTYLQERLFARPLGHNTPFGITEVAHEHGRIPGSKLLYFERQRADDDMAERLKINVGDPVIAFRRQRTINDIPVCIELCYIPAALVPGLSASDVVENASLYNLFSRKYGIELRSGDSKLVVSRLRPEEADFLNLPPEHPVLEFQTVSVLKNNQPFEYLRSLNHPDYVSFHISAGQDGEQMTQRNSVKFSLDETKIIPN